MRGTAVRKNRKKHTVCVFCGGPENPDFACEFSLSAMFSRLLARAPSALARAHHVSALPAVRKAAPAFSAPAVVNGGFKHVALKDYAGT